VLLAQPLEGSKLVGERHGECNKIPSGIYCQQKLKPRRQDVARKGCCGCEQALCLAKMQESLDFESLAAEVEVDSSVGVNMANSASGVQQRLGWLELDWKRKLPWTSSQAKPQRQFTAGRNSSSKS
jgi:hypothetical protein